MSESKKTTWAYCPECGSSHIRHEEGEHKQCGKCHQEWFSDIDYTDTVRANLADRVGVPDLLGSCKRILAAIDEEKRMYLNPDGSERKPSADEIANQLAMEVVAEARARAAVAKFPT